mgnify:CR=1 FL=1
MIKLINLAKEEETILFFKECEKEDLSPLEIRFRNIHLLDINKTLGRNVFYKNDLFANAGTLYDAMQPVGIKRSHNTHGLTPEEIYFSLKNLSKTTEIYPTYDFRYIVVSNVIAACGYPIVAIIEIGSSLSNNMEANINKLTTIYPKDLKKLRKNKKKRASR